MLRPREPVSLMIICALLLLITVSTQAQWEQTNDDGFGIGSSSTESLVVFNGTLYAGLRNPGAVYRLGNPTASILLHWREVDLSLPHLSDLPDDIEDIEVPCMYVFMGEHDRWPWLYVAVHAQTRWGEDVRFVLRSQTGYAWELASEVWEQSTHGEIKAMEAFEGSLYVAFGDTQRVRREPFRVLRTDGIRWYESVSSGELELGLGDWYFGVLKTYGGHLYAGTFGLNESMDPARTAEVWRTGNGDNWTKIGDLTSPTVAQIQAMEVFDGALYVGTKNHALSEELTGPELWRFDGSTWENLSADSQPFVREALHVDKLLAHHGVLYAATGGGPRGAAHTRLYRSTNGEVWEQITPDSVRLRPEENYATGALVSVGEFLYFGSTYTGLNETEVWRLANIRSNVGPCLAQHNSDIHLLYAMPTADRNIVEFVLNGSEPFLSGPVHDQDVAREWANTTKQPVTYGFAHTGLSIRTEYLQLVYRDPEDQRIWQTRKTNLGARYWYWETPSLVEGALTHLAPAATSHDWSGISGPQMTVAYVDPDTSEIHFRVKEGTRWSAEYTIPRPARTTTGPEIVSFQDVLYVIARGYGFDAALYIARKEINNAINTQWTISGIPRAFTRRSTTDRAAAAVVFDGALIVAYVGHNNDYIWLRRSTDGVTWERLGYIRGPETENTPDLAVRGSTLYLAFRPSGDQEICFGTLELDLDNEQDTAGHTWRSLRPMSCCPSCIL